METDKLDITKISQPVIHKDMGGYQLATRKLDYLIKNNIYKDKFKKPYDLLIVTVSTYSEPTILEKSLIHLGIKDFVILNEQMNKWNFFYKIKWLNNYLSNRKFKEKYLLFLDSRDAILQDNPQKIIDLFLKKKCKLLFNATEFDQDFWKKCNHWWHDDVKNIIKLNDPNDYYHYCKKNFANNNPVFLNSGGFIGELEYIKKTFLFIEDNTPSNVALNFTSDQPLINNYLPLFPEIKIDYTFEVFFRNTFINFDNPRSWKPSHISPYF